MITKIFNNLCRFICVVVVVVVVVVVEVWYSLEQYIGLKEDKLSCTTVDFIRSEGNLGAVQLPSEANISPPQPPQPRSTTAREENNSSQANSPPVTNNPQRASQAGHNTNPPG